MDEQYEIAPRCARLTIAVRLVGWGDAELAGERGDERGGNDGPVGEGRRDLGRAVADKVGGDRGGGDGEERGANEAEDLEDERARGEGRGADVRGVGHRVALAGVEEDEDDVEERDEDEPQLRDPGHLPRGVDVRRIDVHGDPEVERADGGLRGALGLGGPGFAVESVRVTNDLCNPCGYILILGMECGSHSDGGAHDDQQQRDEPRDEERDVCGHQTEGERRKGESRRNPSNPSCYIAHDEGCTACERG